MSDGPANSQTEQEFIRDLRRCLLHLVRGLAQPRATLDSPDVRRGLIAVARLVERRYGIGNDKHERGG